MTQRAQTTPDKLLVVTRPTPARVTVERARLTTDDNSDHAKLSRLVLDSASDAYEGKQGAAAAKLGKDDGNFTRDMKRIAGVLDGLGPDFCARLGLGLVELYGPQVDPKVLALRDLDEIDALTKRLRQYINFAA